MPGINRESQSSPSFVEHSNPWKGFGIQSPDNLTLALKLVIQVALAYTEDSIWRNRDQFIQGRDEIKDFLTKKWQRETRYKYV